MTCKMKMHWALWTMVLLAGSGCSPKFYKVDQQTVMEDEAAGEWPEFEKEILNQTQSGTPTPFPSVAVSSRKGRLFSVLNGELVSEEGKPGEAPAKKREVSKR